MFVNIIKGLICSINVSLIITFFPSNWSFTLFLNGEKKKKQAFEVPVGGASVCSPTQDYVIVFGSVENFSLVLLIVLVSNFFWL